MKTERSIAEVLEKLEVNRHFGDRLRRPVEPGQISVVLRRMCRMGRIRQVRRGRPHWEALYVREAPEEFLPGAQR